jgi:hypothetical protein
LGLSVRTLVLPASEEVRLLSSTSLKQHYTISHLLTIVVNLVASLSKLLATLADLLAPITFLLAALIFQRFTGLIALACCNVLDTLVYLRDTLTSLMYTLAYLLDTLGS